MEIRGNFDAIYPALDLTNCNYVTISFYIRNNPSFPWDGSDILFVKYTTDDGVSSTTIDEIDGSEISNTFTKFTYHLSGLNSSNFKVMFDGAANSSSGLGSSIGS